MKIETKQMEELAKKLPEWAVKQHPVKKNMSTIHPMAIIDRLNDVFGIGGWNFTTDFISCDKEIQKTQKGERNVYVSAVKGRLEIDKLVIEQFGGSTNDDKGDALKGGATDALTKIASYLGVGAEIYKGKGNVNGGGDDDNEEELPNTPFTKSEVKNINRDIDETDFNLD